MNYKVYSTDTFNKIFITLDRTEQEWIVKIKRNLEENPTGKILTFGWFREKKYLNKRLYYLVDEENKKILLVGFAPKKEQQKLISFVKANMKEFLNHLRSL